MKRIINWLLRRKPVYGFDPANGNDMGCEIYGYIKNGELYITKTKYISPKS